jgi:hypothetical protein
MQMCIQNCGKYINNLIEKAELKKTNQFTSGIMALYLITTLPYVLF